uniref:Ig-like domain-containing protein n=1 Tax=Cyprinodon variegatus TaxID=28743 RepID=A0A3Q2DR10_CYPVA
MLIIPKPVPQIHISSRSPGRSPARRLDETDEAQLERLYKPVFVMKPSACKCSEGQTARFDLKVVGRPMPDTYWFHNGKLRMVNEFGYCSLDYEVAYARDSGVITCRATNKFGVDQTSATLIVKDEKGLVEESQLPEGRRGIQPEDHEHQQGRLRGVHFRLRERPCVGDAHRQP